MITQEKIKINLNSQKNLTQKQIHPQHLSTTLLLRKQEENPFYGKFDLMVQNLEHLYYLNP
ncbi:unnamed protein product [Paramecium sonneborni]|uniref:Uncharacterized protein n=1 Tax=Paramecium sonneborni TaxID=65129 RepID=A0A8S1RML8_9CILI|nr:unnamed protein product [Paramecium sonneborni]